MKFTKIVLSTAAVVAFGLNAVGVSASAKPDFEVYQSDGSIYLKTTKNNSMYHIKAVKDSVNKFGQFKTKHISYDVYFNRAGVDKLTNVGHKYGIINSNWKGSKIYVTELNSKQIYKTEHSNTYESGGVKSTMQTVKY